MKFIILLGLGLLCPVEGKSQGSAMSEVLELFQMSEAEYRDSNLELKPVLDLNKAPQNIQEQARWPNPKNKASNYNPPVESSPYNAGGRLFVKWPDGKNSICSAQFVDGPNQLLTAAHCVYREFSSQPWPVSIVFFQRYSNGNGRRVEIGKSCITIPNTYMNIMDRWIKNGNERGTISSDAAAFDLAYIGTITPSDVEVPPTWLNFGQDFNFAAENLVTSTGYPGYSQTMLASDGTVDNYSGSRTGVKRMPNSGLGGGSSGGAWYHYDKNGKPLVVGINSFTTNSEDIWSALVDDQKIPKLGECLKSCTNPCNF